MQVWTLTRDADCRGAVLECRADTDQPVVVSQRIPMTDFPFLDLGVASFTLWVCDNPFGQTLMLPSEY